MRKIILYVLQKSLIGLLRRMGRSARGQENLTCLHSFKKSEGFNGAKEDLRQLGRFKWLDSSLFGQRTRRGQCLIEQRSEFSVRPWGAGAL